MLVTCEFEQVVWTAAETEELTGVPPLTQRAWRNRNFLGPRLKVRGLTSGEVAQISTLRAMRQQGIDLEAASPTAQRASNVLWFAINADPNRLIEPVGSSTEIEAFKAALLGSIHNAVGDWPFLKAALKVGDEGLKRFIVATNEYQGALSSIDQAFEAEDLEAAVVVDLLAIGNHLARRASRPLIYARKIRLVEDATSHYEFAAVPAESR